MLILSKERRLNQHRRDEVDAFKYFEIDLHMMWQLSSFLFNFEFLSLVLLPTETLCEKFLVSRVLIDLDENFMRLINVAKSEGGHTSLSQRSVVQNLVIDGLYSNHLIHMRFLQEVLDIVNSIMKSMVIGLVQCSSDTHSRSAMKMHLVNEL